MSHAQRYLIAQSYRAFARCLAAELARYLYHGLQPRILVDEIEDLWREAVELDGGDWS
jgi:hypothetical protein